VLLAVDVLAELSDALSFAFGMFREILWALILGFALSGAVQAAVSKGEMRRLLRDDSPRTLSVACGLGTASSSCSYAAVALARSIFLGLAALLVWRYFRRGGGLAMLMMMGKPMAPRARARARLS
jgi:uncharacterized membrane protein YraQ (UPF0718 family)